MRLLFPVPSEFWGIQDEPLGVSVCARSRVGFLHVWLQPSFLTSYFLFPLSLSPAPSSVFTGRLYPQGCKGGEQSFRNPQRHFTENKYNRGGSSPVAEEVTPSVGFPQSLPTKDGACLAPADFCPLGSGQRLWSPNLPCHHPSSPY